MSLVQHSNELSQVNTNDYSKVQIKDVCQKLGNFLDQYDLKIKVRVDSINYSRQIIRTHLTNDKNINLCFDEKIDEDTILYLMKRISSISLGYKILYEMRKIFQDLNIEIYTNKHCCHLFFKGSTNKIFTDIKCFQLYTNEILIDKNKLIN